MNYVSNSVYTFVDLLSLEHLRRILAVLSRVKSRAGNPVLVERFLAIRVAIDSGIRGERDHDSL